MDIQQVRIGQVAKVTQGSTLSRLRTKGAQPSQLRPVKLLQVKNMGGLLPKEPFGEEELDPEKVEDYRVQPGYVLVSQVATSLHAVVTLEEHADLVIGSNITVVKPDPTQIDPYYLAGILNTRSLQRFLERHAIGTTTPYVGTSIVRDFEVPLPNLQTQRRIGEAFLAIESIRQAAMELTRAQFERMEHLTEDLRRAGAAS